MRSVYLMRLRPQRMAQSVYRTLIRSAANPNRSFIPLVLRRSHSSYPEGSELEAEARAVQKIEDAIHSIIIKRSKPDWLPFMPGASYWVPPRRNSFGVQQIVDKFANALTDEEYLSLTTFQGWPSSAFYINNDTSGNSGEDEKQTTESSLQEEERVKR